MRRSQDEKLTIPISSMIDIVFLLVIFFVVTSSIAKEAVEERELATSEYVAPDGTTPPAPLVVNIRDNGDITLAGLPSQSGQIDQLLHAHRLTFGHAAPVVIRAEENVEFATVSTVMDQARKAGLYRIRLATEHIGE